MPIENLFPSCNTNRLEKLIYIFQRERPENMMVKIFDDEIDVLKAALVDLRTFASLKKSLTAIAEGYPTHGSNDRYVIVENPASGPDNCEDPNLVIDTWTLFGTVPDEEAEYLENADILFNNS